MNKTGSSWEMLPKDFPPYSTVYYYHRRWQKQGIWYKINQVLREQVRKGFGKNTKPTAAAIDSQSVKMTEKSDCLKSQAPCYEIQALNWNNTTDNNYYVA